MSATLLYRIPGVLLFLLSVGHTHGFLSFKPNSAEGMRVREAMDSATFGFEGKPYSYGNFYRRFGQRVTSYLLFSAFLAWFLGDVAARVPGAIVALAWAFVGVQIACLGLSVCYLFRVPALLSGTIAVGVTRAAWLVSVGGTGW